jgi:hypothetical protein
MSKVIYTIIALVATIAAVNAEPDVFKTDIPEIGESIVEIFSEGDLVINFYTPVTYEEYSALDNTTKEGIVAATVVSLQDKADGASFSALITVRTAEGNALSSYRGESIDSDTDAFEDVRENIKYATKTGKVIY